MSSSNVDAVVQYYQQCNMHYQYAWSNLHYHFGYRDGPGQNHQQSLENMNQQVARRAKIRINNTVLDAGCGVGGASIWFARNLGATVDGITIVPLQVEIARLNVLETGLQNQVHFHLMDYTNTSFAANSFDAVVAIESSCYAADKKKFLEEAFRVLKPGGMLVVCDGYRRQRSYWSRFDQYLMRSWLDGWAIPDVPTAEEFIRWSQEVGFEDTKLEDISRQTERSHRELYEKSVWLEPISAVLTGLGLRSAVEHGNIRAARDQWRAIQKGLCFQAFVSARKPVD